MTTRAEKALREIITDCAWADDLHANDPKALRYALQMTRERARAALAPLPPDTAPATLRPELLAFAQAMEAKLRTHDGDRGPRGWENDVALRLWFRLKEEVEELRRALVLDHGAAAVASEAADVANFAMMVADVCGALAPASPPKAADLPHAQNRSIPATPCARCGGTGWVVDAAHQIPGAKAEMVPCPRCRPLALAASPPKGTPPEVPACAGCGERHGIRHNQGTRRDECKACGWPVNDSERIMEQPAPPSPRESEAASWRCAKCGAVLIRAESVMRGLCGGCSGASGAVPGGDK